MILVAICAAALALPGMGLALAGLWLVRRLCAAPHPAPASLPPISVLRPLYGDEPLLEEALASACAQDYPHFQVVFGVQDPQDPALAVVQRLRARFPGHDIALVVDDRAPGRNRKVANLTNMLDAARHDVLVIADSDVHVPPDYLRRIAATLEQPGTGLVTTAYAGLPTSRSLTGRLGASAITHGFLPGALLSRAFGRQDALGATMALRRQTLAAIGGFAALRDELADDNLLGRNVRAQGLAIRLAAVVPATAVPETRLADLFRHELRWGRTIRALAPLPFAASALQFPLAWALLALLASGGAVWAVALFAAAWAVRAIAACGIDRTLGMAARGLAGWVPVWHLPLRDLMSLAVVLASYTGNRVDWRGRTMRAGPEPMAPHSLEIGHGL
jgi:ceramide glucosyltransferase